MLWMEFHLSLFTNFRYLVGLGAVTAIVDSLVEIVRNQASIHLCFDVALQFIERLVTAGAKDAEVRFNSTNFLKII